MNAQAVTAKPKAINWNKVFRVTFRFALAVSVFAFKLALIALAFIVGLLTSGEGTDQNREDSSEDDDVMYKFGSESKYEVFKNHTRY